MCVEGGGGQVVTEVIDFVCVCVHMCTVLVVCEHSSFASQYVKYLELCVLFVTAMKNFEALVKGGGTPLWWQVNNIKGKGHPLCWLVNNIPVIILKCIQPCY